MFDLAAGATDHLVLDEFAALSVNSSVMRPIIAGLCRHAHGTVTVLREETSCAASTIQEIQTLFHEWTTASLVWSGPGSLQASDNDHQHQRKQEPALVDARYDLFTMNLTPAAPEARLMQRWHAALFWRRSNSMVR